MYEQMTFQKLLEDMLKQIPSNMDKREGSIIYDALAPAAMELANLYAAFDFAMEQSFADSASREYLVKRCAERGIKPFPATHAILKGEFNCKVPIGFRFNLDDFNYIVTEYIEGNSYKLQCETQGETGNQYLGELLPIEYLSGLTSAQLTEVLIPGENEETTEHLRSRYFASLDTQAFGGNIADYKKKVNAISGVGGVKVFPAWQGGGTVKLVIITADFQKPSLTLLESVQEIIDPAQQGKGMGLAPIGHTVTIIGAEPQTVDISTIITYQSGYSWARIEQDAQAAVDRYFEQLRATWEDTDNLVVRISQIETRLLDVPGVLDIRDTVINKKAENYVIASENIPVRGELHG